jgi:signal transduction histidine kinase
LHDGAGSQLVSLLAAVRHSGMSPQQMEQALIEAIADLRLVMDSIDSFGADLAEALGQFRSRLEPRLKAAGLHSIWRTANLPEGLKLSPRRMLNIFRALQEALVNVIKHAKASEVQISAREAGSALEFVVQDNGVGLAELPAEDSAPRGRGRLNLEQRMKALGGYARFQTASPNGLAVHLLVPIPNANETNL